MKLLRDLSQLTFETKKEDLSKLPQDVMTSIKSNIRKGAEDLQQKWANALELVHRAYEIDGVQRPNPQMDSAWTQYEENLQYAVQQLAKHRGMDDDWRMSSSVFHEAREEKIQFRVDIRGKDLNESFTFEGTSPDDIVKLFENGPYNVKVHPRDNRTELTFSRWNIRRNIRVVIEPLT